MKRWFAEKPPGTACPGEAALRRLLEAEASPTAAGVLERHLAGCAACRARLHRWSDLGDDLRVRLAGAGGRMVDDPAERGLVVRLRAALDRSDALHRSAAGDAGADRFRPDRIGPYRIEHRAGSGGMSEVFEAVDPRLGRRVALKMILAADVGTPAVLDRFRREGAVLAALDHPNIVPVHELGEHDGRPFLVLEFVPGGPLSRRLAGRPLAPREAARAVATLARAVGYAHDQGVIHRDLKPGNILLKPDRSPAAVDDAGGPRGLLNGDRLMIADFGLARWRRDHSELSRPGLPIGTPAYMAPEQAAARRDDLGPAVDIYALGVILYELLTGRPPFQAGDVALALRMVQESQPVPPRALQPGVPRDLETITLKCLEKEPGRRYPTAGDLADDLERFLQDRTIVARPVGSAERAWRWCRRNPGLAALGALASLLLAGIVAGSVTFAAVQADLRRRTELREGEARAARDLASLSLQRALAGYSVVVDGVLAIDPIEEPRIRSVRDGGHTVLAGWCEEYLDALPNGSRWTAADLQIALMLARVRFELGQDPEAEALLTRVRLAADPAIAADPIGREASQILAMSAMQLGNTLHRQGRDSEAAEAYERADRTLEGLLRVLPGDGYYLALRFGLLGNLAWTLSRLGRTEEAIRAERVGIRTLEAIIQIRPGDPGHPVELGIRSARLGWLYRDLGRWEDAASALTVALDQLGRVPADSPRIAEVRRVRLACLRDRAHAHRNLGRPDAVAPDLEEALALVTDPGERSELQAELAAAVAGGPDQK